MRNLTSTLCIHSIILGLATHLVFHKYEPTSSTASRAFIILLLEPLLLCFISTALNPTQEFSESTSSFMGLARVTTLMTLIVKPLIITYLTFYTTLITSIVFYRLSPFHPLAKVPGPILFKITKWWAVWKYKDGKHHLVLKDLHDIYGSVVRIGPNEISIVDAEVINTILGVKGLPKGTSYTRFRVSPDHPGSLLVLKGDEHTARRRVWNRAMSADSLKGYEDVIACRAQELVERLEIESARAREGGVDLTKWLNYFAFDLMSDLGFGGGSNMLKDGCDTYDLWETTSNHASFDFLLGQVPWIPRSLDKKIPWLAHRQNTLPRIAMEWSLNRIKNGAVKKDIWYHLMDEAGLEKMKPDIMTVTADAILTIIAGSDTTSMSIITLFWLLLSHPGWYEKVQKEVDWVYNDGDDPLDVSKHEELRYLSACINETLRLYPPLLAGGSREVPKGSGGKIISGHYLPEGTQIYLPTYLIHRDPKNFSPNPDSFIPERWLSPTNDIGMSTTSTFTHNPKAYIPFSYGPGTCAGKNLARMEMLMLVSLLMKRFEFRFVDGFDVKGWEGTLRSLFVTKRGPMEVKVKVRKR